MSYSHKLDTTKGVGTALSFLQCMTLNLARYSLCFLWPSYCMLLLQNRPKISGIARIFRWGGKILKGHMH